MGCKEVCFRLAGMSWQAKTGVVGSPQDGRRRGEVDHLGFIRITLPRSTENSAVGAEARRGDGVVDRFDTEEGLDILALGIFFCYLDSRYCKERMIPCLLIYTSYGFFGAYHHTHTDCYLHSACNSFQLLKILRLCTQSARLVVRNGTPTVLAVSPSLYRLQ